MPEQPGEREVQFIGVARTPWPTRGECPRNLEDARKRGGRSTIELAGDVRPGLLGLEAFEHIIVLIWMDEAERDILVQFPHGSPTPRGVFSIRSPARPNPIALEIVRLFSVDLDRGTLVTEALDCRDGTPVIDIKPYYPTLDIPPGILGQMS